MTLASDTKPLRRDPPDEARAAASPDALDSPVTPREEEAHAHAATFDALSTRRRSRDRLTSRLLRRR